MICSFIYNPEFVFTWFNSLHPRVLPGQAMNYSATNSGVLNPRFAINAKQAWESKKQPYFLTGN
jgi:hypothetical protein